LSTTISIDTGGTFTDGYFTHGETVARVKVDTTPHDLTECLAECVREGADKLGFPSVQALLLECETFRFSSTIGTNSIIQRTGPRIGLLVSPGETGGLYGTGESQLYEFFIRKELVIEVSDAFNAEEVQEHVNTLLVRGARILVASLEGSDQDPAGELAIKQVIQREYPRHYLGAVPCLLASEVTTRPGAERRTATAVINAYLHPDMVKILYKADEDARTGGYPHPLLIAHASGGVARVAKTRAIETYNSGPVGGVYGSQRMLEAYRIKQAVAVDIGGTSTDITVLAADGIPFDPAPAVEGVPVHTPMVRIKSVGGGGGSIVRLTPHGYTIGPDSAGASPGPACYGLGGTHATGTDAEVVLGNIDPDWFLGGRRRLDAGRARAAIEKVAGDRSAVEAAWEIHEAIVSLVAREILQSLKELKLSPGDFSLFAFGGAGGLYAAEIAAQCGVHEVLCFDPASVFSAFGIAGMDLSHVYDVPVNQPGDKALAALRRRAELDVMGEGFPTSALSFQLEVEDGDAISIVEINGDWGKASKGLAQFAGRARLRASVPIERGAVSNLGSAGGDKSRALKANREVFHTGESHSHAAVYDRELLEVGKVIDGPALIEARDTTLLIPPDQTGVMDQYGTIFIAKGARSPSGSPSVPSKDRRGASR